MSRKIRRHDMIFIGFENVVMTDMNLRGRGRKITISCAIQQGVRDARVEVTKVSTCKASGGQWRPEEVGDDEVADPNAPHHCILVLA